MHSTLIFPILTVALFGCAASSQHLETPREQLDIHCSVPAPLINKYPVYQQCFRQADLQCGSSNWRNSAEVGYSFPAIIEEAPNTYRMKVSCDDTRR